jgi:hypothetical protein
MPTSPGRLHGHAHGEAFCRMLYVCEGPERHAERIWNSRDGVTPFIVGCRSCGASARHELWDQDEHAPGYQPAIGERIFVDLNPERAAMLARRNVERFMQDPGERQRILVRYGSADELARRLAVGYVEHEGSPDLIEVTEDVLRWLAASHGGWPPDA